MNRMRGLIVFMAIVGATVYAAGGLEPGLTIKFGTGFLGMSLLGINTGKDNFFTVPTSETDAQEANWTLIEDTPGPMPQFKMYCYPDRIICTFYDDTGYVSGLQVCYPKDKFTNNKFDVEVQGLTTWDTTIDGASMSCWAQRQYYGDEEFYNTSKEERLASRNSSRTVQAGLWLTGPGQKLQKVPILETDIVEEGYFTKQACIIAMGQHYYYKMSSTTKCTAEDIYPWFVATHNGELVLSAPFHFATMTLDDGARDWFEHPPQLAVQMIVPNGSQCFYDLAGNPKATTAHVYYCKEPWKITC